MSKHLKVVLVVALVLVVACASVMVKKCRARAAEHDLAAITPLISSVTVYDIDGRSLDSNALASATSAPFPVEVFRQSCASAIHESVPTLWKGSSLAVLTLRDGTTRGAHLSYYGGFFTVDGASGRFVVRGGSSSEFHRLYLRLIQEQFVPRRYEKTTRKASDG